MKITVTFLESIMPLKKRNVPRKVADLGEKKDIMLMSFFYLSECSRPKG